MIAFALSAVLAVAPFTAADVRAPCQAGAVYVGTLHASLAYDVDLFGPPKSKTRLTLNCAGDPVVVYLIEFNAKDVAKYADAYGEQLGTDSGAYGRDGDALLIKAGTLAIVSGPARAFLKTALEKKGFTAHRLKAGPRARGAIEEQLAATIDCSATSTDPLRSWCVATRVKLAAFKAPTQASTHVGISAFVPADADLRESLIQGLALSVVAIDANKILLQSIAPENDQDSRDVMRIVSSVSNRLRTSTSPVEVDAALGKDLDGMSNSLPTKGNALKVGPTGATFKGPKPSRAWLIEGVYVMFEESPEGISISLFPAVPYVAK